MIVYALLGFLLAPWLLEKTLVDTMREDFDAELRIEKVEINPFALSLRIEGLELDNPEGDPTARIGEVFANFQLSSIYRLAFTFDEIRISSPEIFVTRDASGKLDLAYLLHTGAAENNAPAVPGEEETSSLLPALVLNFIIEDFVVYWLDQFPLETIDTRFGPIAITINELNTIPNRSGQQTVVIDTENSGTLSWNGDLQLNPVQSSGHALLDNTRFPLISAYIRHQTGIDITDGLAQVELDYEVFTSAEGELKARIDNFNLTLNDLVLNSFSDGTGMDFAGEDSTFLTLPRIRLTDGRLSWPEQIVSLGSIVIEEPVIDVARDENGVFSLEPRQAAGVGTAEPAVAPDNAKNAQDQWQLSVDNLVIDALALNLLDRTVNPETIVGITDFNLDVRKISNQPNQRFPASLSLQALTGGSLVLEGEITVLPELLFEFDVNVDALQLAATQPYVRQQANLNVDSGAINLDGHISGSPAEPFSFKGDLEVNELAIAESVEQEQLAAWEHFRADNIAFSAAERRLDISSLQFDQLYGDILINEDGSLNLGQVKKGGAAAPADDTGEAIEQAQSQDQDPGLKIRIGKIALAQASADFADLSLPLPFSAKVQSLNGNMTTISTESSEPSNVELEGKVGEFGYARVSGNVTPLEPSRNTDILLSFENIDVPSFTPYSIPFAGREIASGRLDLKLGYVVKDGQMAGDNSIVLRDFELGKEVPHPDAMDVPLGLAVALLKDADGKIDIDLPVRGNVNDPEFNYGSVVMTALGRFLVKIVLYPFAALGKLLGIESNELEHIKFLDGRSDLTPPEMERAGKLVEALKLRPELQLSIGGVYDPDADGLALRSSRLDRLLESKIAEVSAESDPELQYADLRQRALEQLYGEQMTATTPTPGEQLEQLRLQFTRPVEVEGEAEPVPTLDQLAYSNHLRARLIELQVISDIDLSELADARAAALKTAMLSIEETLRDRILIAENKAVTRADDDSIQMKVTLSGKADESAAGKSEEPSR